MPPQPMQAWLRRELGETARRPEGSRKGAASPAAAVFRRKRRRESADGNSVSRFWPGLVAVLVMRQRYKDARPLQALLPGLVAQGVEVGLGGDVKHVIGDD